MSPAPDTFLLVLLCATRLSGGGVRLCARGALTGLLPSPECSDCAPFLEPGEIQTASLESSEFLIY